MMSRRFNKLLISRWLTVGSNEGVALGRLNCSSKRNCAFAGPSGAIESGVRKVKFPRLLHARHYVQNENSCPKCGHASQSGFKCLLCGSLILPPQQMTLFDVLGQEVSYDVAESKLKVVHRQLQTEFHPDKYSQKDPDERLKSEEISSLINKAYFTLSNPYERGMYLLQLKNHHVDEGDIQLGTDFLAQIMESNEELENITTREELEKFENSNEKEIQKLTSLISVAFVANNLAAAKADLNKMKYFISIRNRLKEMERNLA